jgi:hypothetical protein
MAMRTIWVLAPNVLLVCRPPELFLAEASLESVLKELVVLWRNVFDAVVHAFWPDASHADRYLFDCGDERRYLRSKYSWQEIFNPLLAAPPLQERAVEGFVAIEYKLGLRNTEGRRLTIVHGASGK